jgi:hypothetical protein
MDFVRSTLSCYPLGFAALKGRKNNFRKSGNHSRCGSQPVQYTVHT